MTSRLGHHDKTQVSSSRALLAAANMKARVITFYRNGKQFEHGIRVSFVLGKTFPHIEYLMDYLTERCADVPNGARYIFTTTGKMILQLEELEHGQSYVISGVKQFQFLPYGQSDHFSDASNSVKSYNSSERSKELPKALDQKSLHRSHEGLGSLRRSEHTNMGSEIKVVTLVNSRHPSVRSRVILNLRTPKSFESVLRDLGDAVQLSNPKKLFNERGQEVRSFSQLRRELSTSNLFYLDTLSKGGSSSSQSQVAVDHSKADVSSSFADGAGLTSVDKHEFDRELKRLDPSPEEPVTEITHRYDQTAAMTAASLSRNDSGRTDPSPTSESVTSPEETDKSHANVVQPTRKEALSWTTNGGRKSILNSWNEGISLEGVSNSSDRFQVAFEEKLKSEIQKAYEVLNNDIHDKRANDEEMRGSETATHDRQSSHPNGGRTSTQANHSSSSNKRGITTSSKSAALASQPDFPSESPIEDSFHVVDGTNMPSKDFSLTKIYGYSSESVNGNFYCLSSGELIYFVAGVVVIWNPVTDTQRFYCEHSRDVERICVFEGRTVASVEQRYSSEAESFVRVRIWTAATLATETTFEESLDDQKLMGTLFAPNGHLLILKGNAESVNGRIWDWKSSRKRVSTAFHHQMLPDELVSAAIFHPRDEDIVVTFGQQHLVLWQLMPDKTGTEMKTFLSQGYSKGPKSRVTVNAAAFLLDDTLLTGNSRGELVLWAAVPSDDGALDFMQRIFHGHNAPVSSIRLLGSHTVASSDFEGGIRIWNVVEGAFDLLTTAQLPASAGSILTLQTLPNRIDELFVISGYDQVFKVRLGSDTSFERVSQLDCPSGATCLTPHPKEESFFVSSGDNRIQKWQPSHGMEWETSLRSTGSSISVHPSGEVLAVATAGGEIAVLTASEGDLISLLPVADVALTCISYSRNGDILAAGSSDGGLYFMQVADDGLNYQSLSILKNTSPITSLQWSTDGQYVLTNVDCEGLRELVLWDLKNARFMAGLERIPENIEWKDPVWSHCEEVQGMWENEKISSVLTLVGSTSHGKDLLACGDEEGIIRLFAYPCNDQRAGFLQRRQGSGSVTSVSFLHSDSMFVSSNSAGSLFIWKVYASSQ